MGANPVQVEVGEFEEGAEEAEEEVVAESRSLVTSSLCPLLPGHGMWAQPTGGSFPRKCRAEVLPKRGWVWKRNGFDLEVRNILWNLGKIYL